MAQTTSSDTELLTEHFGYPLCLLDDIINSINILAERALNSVEQGLLNAPPATLGFRPPPPQKLAPKSRSKHDSSHGDPPDDESPFSPEEQARREIENGSHQLETLLCASIDRNFDKFELYVLRNILCVRPEDRAWIRLGHYEGLDFAAVKAARTQGPDGGDGSPSLQSVNALRRRLAASQRLNAMLHAEKTRNDALLAELRTLVGGPAAARAGAGAQADGSGSGSQGPSLFDNGPEVKSDPDRAGAGPAPLAFLGNKGSLTEGDAERPLTTTTAFTLSQLQALRALSTSLRNILPDLAEERRGCDGPSEGQKGWRSERLEYVESATRRHLENVRGLELGRSGEVADGEWQGEGRNIAPGEVESLEKVVAMFGGPPESRATGNAMDET